jgi:hypothetical protein
VADIPSDAGQLAHAIGDASDIIGKRLSDIQAELGELHVEVSRLFVLALNANPKADAPGLLGYPSLKVVVDWLAACRTGGLLQFHHLAEFVWLAGFSFADDFRRGLEQAENLAVGARVTNPVGQRLARSISSMPLPCPEPPSGGR